jgi:hypothetical protein
LGCGYHSLYAQQSAGRLSVQLGQVLVPEPGAAQAVASGARDELAAAGMLGEHSEFPRLVIDVLRVDEVSRGVRIVTGRPAAGGMSIAVVVRARVFGADSPESLRDSGDLRRAAQAAGDADPRLDGAAYDLALRAAAERAGRAAARAVTGIPEPSDEAP